MEAREREREREEGRRGLEGDMLIRLLSHYFRVATGETESSPSDQFDGGVGDGGAAARADSTAEATQE
jgi:hypothetical protein